MNCLISFIAVCVLYSCIGAINAVGRDSLCPYPSVVLTFFADPYDCTKFYECYDGEKSTLSCPTDLYWNQNSKVCDYKENVKCDPIPEPNPSSDATKGPVDSTSGAPQSTSSGTPFTPDPHCPWPSDILTYDYYPGNCTAFYECDHGLRYLMNCPQNLEWNHYRNYCDYPENVDCSRSSTTTVSSVPTTSDPRCVGKPDGTLIGNEHDCSVYYECLAGKSILFNCPAGTEWNDSLKICDYPDRAGCIPK